MPKKHTVAAGECLSSIAHQYGLPGWRALYEHPANEALRAKRPNPHVLLPGDVVVVPEPARKQEEVPVDRTHRFVVTRPKVRLCLDLLEAVGGDPVEMLYELVVEGVEEPFKGLLGADGRIDVMVPASASSATLRLLDSEEQVPRHVVSLRIGELDPVDSPSGVQERLRRLGFQCEPERSLGPRTRAALARFQLEFRLPVSGEPDEVTQDKLVELAGA